MIPEAAIRRLNAAYAGRARDEAYLELAQEHFLAWLQAEGVLDELVFKGGTSLRKFVFGLRGRFSLDLDFTALDRGAGELVIEALAKGFVHEGVSFRGFDIDRGAMKGAWRADAPRLGETALACRLDFSTRRLLLPSVAKQRQPLPGVDEHHLGFALVEARIADLRETCAEKLARLRRVKFARDIYDLDLLAPEVRSGLGLVRELLLFKVYFDVVDDVRGAAPFGVDTEYTDLDAASVVGADDLGALTRQKADIAIALSAGRQFD